MNIVAELTLDYNTAAVVFGLGSANRLDLMKPLVDTLCVSLQPHRRAQTLKLRHVDGESTGTQSTFRL